MKSLIVCIFLCIGLYSCTPQHSAMFKIDGTIEGVADSTEISVNYTIRNDGHWEDVSHTAYVINHQFHMEGNITELTAGFLFFDNKKIPIYLEPTDIKVIIDKDHPYDYKISGISVKEESREIIDILSAEQIKCDKVVDTIQQVFDEINRHEDDSCFVDSLMQKAYYWRERRNLHSARLDSLQLRFVSGHLLYRIAPYLIYELARNKTTNIDTIMTLYNQLPESVKETMLGKLAFDQINETSLIVKQKVLQVRDVAPDFSRKNAQGKVIRLSDFRNKQYVLLDFWASWCGPCLKQMPQIKKLQSTFADRGLKIIGLSCDRNEKDWLDAINQHQLGAWEQLLEHGNLNDTYFVNPDDIATKYNVNGIPQCFLIDKQGKILLKCHHIGEEEIAYIDNILAH